MPNQKTEGLPRSESFFQSAARRPFFPEPGYYLPIIDEKLLELARLFAEEEKLAAQIQDDGQVVDKEIIYEVVTVARKIAKTGCHTTLVPTNEILDIAQIFCLRDPNTARIAQELVLEDPQAPKARLLGQAFLEYVTTLPTGPNADTASNILIKILASLKELGNPAWTARVAASLAYFSALEN